MTCRCAERAEAIVRAAIAISKGDRKAARDEVRFIGRSAREDITSLKDRAAAAVRLKGRRSG